jgi:molybdenum cofactor biosynthesis protein B
MEGKLSISVLTVSDTRTSENDTSGQYLVDALQDSGHVLSARDLVKDNIYSIRAVVSQWIADDGIQVVLITGGTGFSARDNTPEAIAPLIEKEVSGFGELFRAISFEEIGTSTVQSRALAGMVNNTLIFCMPGSTGACRTGWEKILREQLDIDNSPCNFAELFAK